MLCFRHFGRAFWELVWLSARYSKALGNLAWFVVLFMS